MRKYTQQGEQSMRKLASAALKSLTTFALAGLLAVGSLTTPAHAASVTINGAGSSFAYPIYSQWAYQYNRLTGMRLNYQSIGSGGGIRQIKAKTVDFGASDAPLKAEELKEAGLMQFPTCMGGVVPVVNLKGIKPGELHLPNEVLADIYLGKITKWNDSRIKEANPGLDLPALDITCVHRSDGSGTTWIYTNYLTKVSPEWAKKVGNSTAVNWPAGVGGKGNEGVAAYVQRINGAIGYVEYAYCLQNHLTFVQLRNQAGNYVAPTSETFQAAASNADWKKAKGFYMVLTNQPGKDSWPITGATYVLVHTHPQNAKNIKAVLDFFNWAYKNGAPTAEKLDYVPMPMSVAKMVEQAWAKEIRVNGKPLWK
jgi:phosphate transport system substrate-binding protein